MGRTLTAEVNGLGEAENVFFQWRRKNTNIGTGHTYRIQLCDVGYAITVAVIRHGYSGGITSDPTDYVTLSALEGNVTIDGTAQVGSKLTANIHYSNSERGFSFQWKRGNVNIGMGSNTYVVQYTDIGQHIRVTVTSSDNSGYIIGETPDIVIGDSSLQELTGTVRITGVAQVGQTLTADIGDLDGAGDLAFLWRRWGYNGNYYTGTTSNTHIVQAADHGYTITVTATRSGYRGIVTSDPTAIVLDRDLNLGFDCFLGENIDFTVIRFVIAPWDLTRRVVVLNPEQYESINWFIRGEQIIGNAISGSYGETLTLDASIHEGKIGTHFITVEVNIEGILYSNVIAFEVSM